jgi:hypothetical protein
VPLLTRVEMLQALQNDVNAWPARVREAGVTNAGGSAYVPVARNNEILRTPDDPEATYAYMTRTWQASDAEVGSAGWFRIVAQAGPELTWEWLIADDNKPYASLFSAETRRRVRAALEADAGYSVWKQREEQGVEAQRQRDDRIRKIREDIRAGKRERLSLPELDQGL